MRRLIAPLLALPVLASGLLYMGHAEFGRAGPLAEDRTLVVPRGAGLAEIAALLVAEGVISDRWLFAAAARIAGRHARLQAGEYAFAAGVSMRAVLTALAEGRTLERRLSVPEGLTVREIFARIAAADGLTGAMPPLPEEGGLLPETYFFSRGDSRGRLVARMRAALEEALAEAWRARGPSLAIVSPREALILASIIERETGRADEYARISAVFHNRLRRGMRLQSDPTVIYALTGGAGALDRKLRRADLRIDSPYNSYDRRGLPPTPIACPGRAAIAAALHPVASYDLYFVADGSGGHAFARTLAEHNRNVASWRRIERARRGTPRPAPPVAAAPAP